MKRFTLILIGVTGLLTTSCSQDNELLPAAKDSILSLEVKIPDVLTTRSIGDGTSATQLGYAVYEVEGSTNTYVFSGSTTFATGTTSTSVTLNLGTGKSYNVVFFASGENIINPTSTTGQVFLFNSSDATLTVDYSNMTTADNLADDYDCFYASYSTGTITSGSSSASVTLKRPVAQINWGSNDLTSSIVTSEYGTNLENLTTTLTTTAYTTLSLLTGDLGGEESITISGMGVPSSSDGTYPVSNYSYLAMQYVLAPASTSGNYDLTLEVYNSNTAGPKLDISNVPLQANYRTNIYGTLLSSETTITVTKNATWSSPDNNYPLVWDGTSTTPTIDTSAKTISVNKPSDLAGLADLVNNGNDYEDYVVSLYNDFDMNGQTFPGIGSATRSSTTVSGNQFKGTLDGQGHTISNVVIEGKGTPGEVVGFIPSVGGSSAIVKDVNFENIKISAPAAEQVGVVGTLTEGATVTNVTVKSGEITAKEGAGGIVGRMILAGTISSCSNNATVTTTGSNTGGIVGAAYYTAEGSTMTVSGCENTGSISGQSQAVGGIAGLCSAEVTGCTNSGTVTNTSQATGGIVGQQNCAGSITNCTNTGKIIGGNGYGTGGIVGWVRYNGTTTDYAKMNIVSVTECKNSASISGDVGVGGIVGIWYMAGICSQNSNTAPTLSGTMWIAGIIGGQQWTTTGPQGTVTGNTNMLYVENNYSSTLQSQMTGGGLADYVYVNSSSNVTQSGNSQTEPDVVNTAPTYTY